jgi:hypothetical protein
LLEFGAKQGRIPVGAFRYALPGQQLVIPPEAFAEFEALRSNGQISVRSQHRRQE